MRPDRERRGTWHAVSAVGPGTRHPARGGPTLRHGYLLGWGVTTLGSGLVFPLTAVYLRDHLGLPVSGVSLYFALFAAAGLVVNPFAGALADRWRPGPIAVAATLVQTVGPLLLALGSARLSVAAALFSGAGTGVFYAVQTPLLISVFGKDRLGRMLASQFRISAATMGAGSILGGLLAGSLGEAGYRLCFAVNGPSYLVFGLILCAVLRRGAPTPRPSAAAAARGPGRALGAALAPFTDRVFLWALLLQGVLVIFGLGQIESVTPIVLRDSAQMAVSGVSVVLAVNSVTVIAVQGLAVRVAERIGPMRSLETAVLTWCLGLLVLWSVPAAPDARGALLLASGYGLVFGIGQCLISPSFQPVVVAHAPPGRVAAYSASTSLIYGMGNLIAPAVCLPVFTSGGLGGYLWLQAAGYAAAGVALLSLRRHAARTRERGPERDPLPVSPEADQ